MRQVAFLDRRVRPDRLEQFLFCNNVPAIFNQDQQGLDNGWAEWDHLSLPKKHSVEGIELERAELVKAPGPRGSSHFGTFQNDSDFLKDSNTFVLLGLIDPWRCNPIDYSHNVPVWTRRVNCLFGYVL
jgi:hypothetical protein